MDQLMMQAAAGVGGGCCCGWCVMKVIVSVMALHSGALALGNVV
jgi:hypothetical protein